MLQNSIQWFVILYDNPIYHDIILYNMVWPLHSRTPVRFSACVRVCMSLRTNGWVPVRA